MPLRCGRGGRKYGSLTNIVNKADGNGNDDGIGCIFLDLAMSAGYHQWLQQQPRQQWLLWLASFMAKVSCCNTEATPRISNLSAAHQHGSPMQKTRQQQCLLAGNMASGTIHECENDDVVMYN
jgi:hypothetical protein